jgi:phosphoglycerate dehydrogenase-like enzyme
MRNAGSIDLAACNELGITVSTTDALHQTTVEITWFLILSLMRQTPRETASLRSGGWQVGLGRGLDGRTLGILGLGNMGIPVARIARNFGMKVAAWSPNLTPERTAPHGVECVSQEELFSRSDVLSIHMPLGPKTRGIVTRADLERMKPTAYLVNTSRPQLVDEEALIEFLEQRRIAGAGLDVYGIEPLPGDHPFRHLPNVVATPQIGFVTEENYEIFYRESLENLAAYCKGSPIRTISAANPFLPDSQVSRQMHATALA